MLPKKTSPTRHRSTAKAKPYLIVGKDGSATDLTFGQYAGLSSFSLNEVGIPSVELGIYNVDVKTSGHLLGFLRQGRFGLPRLAQ